MRRTFSGHTRVKRIPGTPAKHINKFGQQLGRARLATACTKARTQTQLLYDPQLLMQQEQVCQVSMYVAHVNYCRAWTVSL